MISHGGRNLAKTEDIPSTGEPAQGGFLEASSSVVECGFIQHAGEGGGVGKGKKDTGYLYKAFMVARRALLPLSRLRALERGRQREQHSRHEDS